MSESQAGNFWVNVGPVSLTLAQHLPRTEVIGDIQILHGSIYMCQIIYYPVSDEKARKSAFQRGKNVSYIMRGVCLLF